MALSSDDLDQIRMVVRTELKQPSPGSGRKSVFIIVGILLLPVLLFAAVILLHLMVIAGFTIYHLIQTH